MTELTGLVRCQDSTQPQVSQPRFFEVALKRVKSKGANGLLRTETRESSDVAQKLTTTFDRTANLYGLVGKTVLSWTDARVPKSRTVSEVDYTLNGRFIKTVTNALGHVEQRAFDARTGAIA